MAQVGALDFRCSDVVAAFLPTIDHQAFREELDAMKNELGSEEDPPTLLDPQWGLERMIAALRGLPVEDVGSLPWRL